MKVSWRGREDSQTHKASTLMVLNKTEVAAATEEQASCEYNEPTQHCAVFRVVVCVRPSNHIYIYIYSIQLLALFQSTTLKFGCIFPLPGNAR